ncbi:MAG: GNAT family N-acetyltransferase [Candidatus Taylorbacteria bacterium]|nr:GNAT family N-acetyltransferase [Candidatus Taylorbacteria bacterium]
MNTKPFFEEKINCRIKNFLNTDIYQMLGGSNILFSEKDLQKIIDICSQKDCYEMIFKRRLNGGPYLLKDAVSYTNWVMEGWRNHSHFAFIVRNNTGEFIGTLDIKSPDLDNAEVGCWADENYRGFMTNAFKELIALAKNAGYKKLYARIKSENSRSYNMVMRSGFIKIEERLRTDGLLEFIYEITLND